MYLILWLYNISSHINSSFNLSWLFLQYITFFKFLSYPILSYPILSYPISTLLLKKILVYWKFYEKFKFNNVTIFSPISLCCVSLFVLLSVCVFVCFFLFVCFSLSSFFFLLVNHHCLYWEISFSDCHIESTDIRTTTEHPNINQKKKSKINIF